MERVIGWQRAARTTAVVALLLTVTVLAVRAMGSEILLAVLRWTDTFVRSPGLGGLAAAGAAVVAFGQWRRQERSEARGRRDRATAGRDARRDQQWWEVYRLVRGDRRPGSSPSTAQDERLLQQLSADAETELQVRAAAVLIASYARPAPPEDDEGAPHVG
ncbi:hypothetical protein [Cellulomonas hominis]|uniref:hypothetical protein n=1 Tax=Cellulomonas hominis TaxID=156981 RepID=UPI001B8E9963|nr:hypothetical protein [Cellulomonas hominis]VTR75729.1 hypothetical protein CHMI_00481 [Cellulomonas hominis]